MRGSAGKWRLWLVTAAMVAFVIACAWLAVWQYHRAHERAARIAAVVAARSAPPARLDSKRLSEWSRYAHVYAEGHYLGARQSLLTEMSRPRGDRVGAEVLTPLVLPSGKLLLVNRGWVPADANGAIGADLAAPAGTVRPAGFLAPLPRPGLHLGGNPVRVTHWPARLLFPGWAELDRLYGSHLMHRQLLLEPKASGGYYRGWQMRPRHSPAQNYSYMVQWSVFGAIAFGLWLWFIPRRLRRAQVEKRT